MLLKIIFIDAYGVWLNPEIFILNFQKKIVKQITFDSMPYNSKLKILILNYSEDCFRKGIFSKFVSGFLYTAATVFHNQYIVIENVQVII